MPLCTLVLAAQSRPWAFLNKLSCLCGGAVITCLLFSQSSVSATLGTLPSFLHYFFLCNDRYYIYVDIHWEAVGAIVVAGIIWMYVVQFAACGLSLNAPLIKHSVQVLLVAIQGWNIVNCFAWGWKNYCSSRPLFFFASPDIMHFSWSFRRQTEKDSMKVLLRFGSYAHAQVSAATFQGPLLEENFLLPLLFI